MFKNIITKTLILFVVLHTLHYLSNYIYYKYCYDSSLYGIFKSIFISHSPICHFVMNVSYFSQTQIYNIMSASIISTSIVNFCELIKLI